MRCRFTLVEVLVTATIIGVLMAILLPTINKAREKARVVQAKADIKALEIAIKQYESTYGFLPVEVRNHESFDSGNQYEDVRWDDFDDDPVNDSSPDEDWRDNGWNTPREWDKIAHTRLVEDLACLGEDPDPSPPRARQNPRGVRMLDKFAQYGNSSIYLSMIDPWQRRYRIVWDLYTPDTSGSNPDRPYDGRIPKDLVNGFHQPTSDKDNPGHYVYASYVIWSPGPDMRQDGTSNDRRNRDNVYSIQTDWKAADGHVPK